MFHYAFMHLIDTNIIHHWFHFLLFDIFKRGQRCRARLWKPVIVTASIGIDNGGKLFSKN